MEEYLPDQLLIDLAKKRSAFDHPHKVFHEEDEWKINIYKKDRYLKAVTKIYFIEGISYGTPLLKDLSDFLLEKRKEIQTNRDVVTQVRYFHAEKSALKAKEDYGKKFLSYLEIESSIPVFLNESDDSLNIKVRHIRKVNNELLISLDDHIQVLFGKFKDFMNNRLQEELKLNHTIENAFNIPSVA